MRGLAFNRGGARALLVAGLMALAGSAVIAAEAETPSVTGPQSGTALDAVIASKASQLAAVKGYLAGSDCDYAVDAPTIEGCDQLEAQAQSLGAEIDSLKAQAAEASVPKVPTRLAPVNFQARTNPNMSYRTFCVRECDGFYYPLSEASQPGSFLAEEAKCQASCSSPAKLFYSALPAGDAGTMVSLAGERYGEMTNAYRYRSEYVEACACKPKPWTAEAKAAFARRAVVATRTPNELIVAKGVGEAARLLANGEVRVAVHAASAKRRYSQALSERPRLRPFFFRPFRNAYGIGAQASAEPLPQRHFFLFRGRY